MEEHVLNMTPPKQRLPLVSALALLCSLALAACSTVDLAHAPAAGAAPVKAFRDWVKADIWKRLFDVVSDDPDMEYTMVDATIVKVHRHGQGAKGGPKTKRSAVRKAA